MTFLDTVKDVHGAQSAAFISFGTNIWPDKRPELIAYMLEVLLEVEPVFRFVFATAAPNATVDENLRKRLAASKRGIIVCWAPQTTILQHEAVRVHVVRFST